MRRPRCADDFEVEDAARLAARGDAQVEECADAGGGAAEAREDLRGRERDGPVGEGREAVGGRAARRRADFEVVDLAGRVRVKDGRLAADEVHLAHLMEPLAEGAEEVGVGGDSERLVFALRRAEDERAVGGRARRALLEPEEAARFEGVGDGAQRPGARHGLTGAERGVGEEAEVAVAEEDGRVGAVGGRDVGGVAEAEVVGDVGLAQQGRAAALAVERAQQRGGEAGRARRFRGDGRGRLTREPGDAREERSHVVGGDEVFEPVVVEARRDGEVVDGEERGVARAVGVFGALQFGRHARGADGEGREHEARLDCALAGAQVGDGLAAEDVFGVLGASAAGRGVEGVDGAAVEGGDEAARLRDGAVGQGVLGGAPAVDLRARVGRQVEPRGAVAPEVADGVGARGDGLRLEGFELRPAARRQLVGDDAAHVVFEPDDVDDCQRALRVGEDFEPAAVGLLVEADGVGGLVFGGEDDGRARVEERQRAAVGVDGRPAQDDGPP